MTIRTDSVNRRDESRRRDRGGGRDVCRAGSGVFESAREGEREREGETVREVP